MYDYGARNYDPAIGRFGTYDPLAETTNDPYGYCFSNPVNVKDPSGMIGEDWVKRGNTVFYDASVTSQADAQSKYGAEAQHLGEGSTTTGSINGEVAYQYTYHNDGTITDCNGNQADAAGGFSTAGGTTIVGTESVFGEAWKSFFSSTASNPVEQYRAWQNNPLYNEGESRFDRICRLIGNSHSEIMLDFGGGGYNMFGGYGAATEAAEISPVQKAIQTLNEIKANGGTVKVNPMSPSQELNMTIQEGSRKLDLRIETHKLPAKYGGDGVNPTRHMNVDMKGAGLPNKGHVKLQ